MGFTHQTAAAVAAANVCCRRTFVAALSSRQPQVIQLILQSRNFIVGQTLLSLVLTSLLFNLSCLTSRRLVEHSKLLYNENTSTSCYIKTGSFLISLFHHTLILINELHKNLPGYIGCCYLLVRNKCLWFVNYFFPISL